jgi:hypothetical protein
MATQCLPLAEDFYLKNPRADEPMMTPLVVSATPYTETSVPLESIPALSEETGLPFFVTPEKEGYCAYPLFSHSTVDQATLVLEKPPRYGSKAQLNNVPEDSAIYSGFLMTSDQTWFTHDGEGSWFLLGDVNNVRHHVDSIQDTTDFLTHGWRSNPWDMLFTSAAYNYEAEAYQIYPHDQAMDEISSFMIWLQTFDPELHRNVAQHAIAYDTNIPMDNFICEAKYRAAYGYQQDGVVVFLPRLIERLVNRDYEFAAAIIAHEDFHRRFQSHDTPIPSERILTAGFEAFKTDVLDKEGYPQAQTDFIAKAIECQQFPITPGEEVLAYIQTYIYAAENLSDAPRRHMMGLALARYNDTMTIMEQRMPAGIFPLEYEYIATQWEHLNYTTDATVETVQFFLQDIQERLERHTKGDKGITAPTKAFDRLSSVADI